MPYQPHPLSTEDALVALMIAVSAADERVATSELVEIEAIIDNLPVFAAYDADRMRQTARVVFDLFSEEDGLDALFGLVREALPERLYETAYALACDIAAADGKIAQPEARMLEEIKEELKLDPLHTAAIERGARARHIRL